MMADRQRRGEVPSSKIMYNPKIHHRHSIRLKNYDYSSGGMYFITICTIEKKCIFRDIINGEMKLSPIGEIANNRWLEIPEHFKNVELDEFIIMPNHVHGIIVINDINNKTNNHCDAGLGEGLGEGTSPLQHIHQPIYDMGQQIKSKQSDTQKRTLGQVVAYYKYGSTKEINTIYNSVGKKIWQRNYYDRIIRNEKELDKICEYIINNPLKWELDKEHPENIKKETIWQ
jgi:putative transposase